MGFLNQIVGLQLFLHILDIGFLQKAKVQGCWKVCQYLKTLQSTGKAEIMNDETAVRQYRRSRHWDHCTPQASRNGENRGHLACVCARGVCLSTWCVSAHVRAQGVQFSLPAGDAPSADVTWEAQPHCFSAEGGHYSVTSHQDLNMEHFTSKWSLPLKMGTWGSMTEFLQLSHLNY